MESSNTVWNTLDPVLRLASSFISEDSLMPFFYNLIFARKTLPESSAGPDSPLEPFTVDSPLTAEQLELTRSWLRDPGFGNYQVSYEFFQETRTFKKRYGYSDAEVWEKTGSENRIVCRVWLNQGFLDTLHDHENGHRLLTACAVLRVRLKMTVTIIREHVHSIYSIVSPNLFEPYFMDQQTSKLGRAWECWMFGGRISL